MPSKRNSAPYGRSAPSVSHAIAIRRTLDCLRSWRLSHGSRAPERRVLTSAKTSVSPS